MRCGGCNHDDDGLADLMLTVACRRLQDTMIDIINYVLDAIVQCTLIDNVMIDARDNRDVVVLSNTNVLIILINVIKPMSNQSD